MVETDLHKDRFELRPVFDHRDDGILTNYKNLPCFEANSDTFTITFNRTSSCAGDCRIMDEDALQGKWRLVLTFIQSFVEFEFFTEFESIAIISQFPVKIVLLK